jgi:hypothetical protein
MQAFQKIAAGSLLLLLLGAPASGQDGEGLPLPAATPKSPTALPATVTTKFDPRIDGLPFVNLGDFASPEGNCIGMSLLAIDAFNRRQTAAAAGQPAPAAPPIAKTPTELDLPLEEASSAVQQAEETGGDDDLRVNKEQRLSNPAAIRAALLRIAKTGEPEVMTLKGGTDGHATVLYGYANGNLQIYDPNYPGETIQWPYDPVKGLGKHPKVKDDPFYAHLTGANSTPFAQFHTSAAIPALTAACDTLAKSCTARFPVVAAAVTPQANGKGVVISGTVSHGPARTFEGERSPAPKYAWVSVNGNPIERVRLGKNGSYKVTAPAADFNQDQNDVRVVATTDQGLLAGYVESKVAKPAPPVSEGMVQALERKGP